MGCDIFWAAGLFEGEGSVGKRRLKQFDDTLKMLEGVQARK